ncbi:LppX_LprAFG lipoprotein [Asanoa sp. WMMD1127]|uniref:LppX_LprAFG lipoprotein n=1 Tax=Asanoa sp. WMMD1127 TaxID=3016107 RepID=UPI002417C552|nr:LppX_LprAFG lipoprotein [Asanoa sp. WMMD1127]MDG4824359.1 LppX_LprAFG lipoprotein [Asanoa sp. WMMD1127]
MRPPRTFIIAVLLAALASVGACGDGDNDATAGDPNLPAAATLLSEAAAKMRTVTSAAFDITTEGETGALPIRSANGSIDQTGTAQGTATLDQVGMPIELSFVAKDQFLYVKGLTAGWQKVPLAQAAAIYDPTAILDPEKGIGAVLASAQGTTKSRETLDGVEHYVVDATFDGAAMARLVPGVTGDVNGTVWIAGDTKLVNQLRFTVPGDKQGTVTIKFADFDKPVDVDVPTV